jgi:predicted 2-oxoglutarate/Fe(II)-dependent dioxygenase YbiX
MGAKQMVAWIAESIEKASRSANFCTGGSLPPVGPGLDVAGVGAVSLPLKPATAKKLIAACRVAPYGKGAKTLVDRKVRNTYELDPQKFQLAEAWGQAIAEVTEQAAAQLGLPTGQLEAKLYKLLVYEPGGFFLPHRDSEKLDRMVASLAVVLPTPFSGGELVVRHEAAQQVFRFEEAAEGNRPSYVAFYADCEHEVRRVTRGRRLCLTYNLVMRPKRRSKDKQAARSSAQAADAVATSINSWIAARPREPLVFALEHQYTQKGLAVDLLKGVDRQVAELILAAAEKAKCYVHLAQVSRHLCQFADDGSFGRGRFRYDSVATEDLEIGETYEDDLTGDQWRDVRGKSRRFGAIKLDTSAIISSVPLEDWKPTSEEYEGYTGNAGNTLDRWYHRSAIVVWHEEHHFDVIVRGGMQRGIELLLSMMRKLEKTPKKHLEQARRDCLRLARAIVRQWPQRPYFSHSLRARDEQTWLADFSELLLKLEDQDTIAGFFAMLAERDKMLRLNKVLPQACRKFGTNVFASQLEALLVTPQGRFDPGVAPRDAEWLAAICSDRKLAAQSPEFLQRLCATASSRFCDTHRWEDRTFHRDSAGATSVLPRLVKACVATRADQALAALIDTVRSAPNRFPLETSQVPCLVNVVPWSKKNDNAVHPLLAKWLATVRAELESATASKPSPPTDWARPAKVDCTCQFCRQLNEFLAAPDRETTRIAAREDRRSHVIDRIRRQQCDVSHKLERKGSPYALILHKTTGSYQRAVQTFETNVKLLQSLPPGE